MKNLIRERRKQLGLTQENLEHLSGIPRSTIANLESDQGRLPNVEVAILLARALKVTVEELFIV
ncbi:helix-turn-helix transcriptional regulator [Intestinibacillus massiliensis]|uniref:helix-turn-helix transcriptional regulator n=1 Tax=Intestinibacillus massiliensis TaxID=1871029 RepID=UPI000B34F5AD|nr:helix-turn-helix domain-containing protein [Intestinibacillus massiliensis]